MPIPSLARLVSAPSTCRSFRRLLSLAALTVALAKASPAHAYEKAVEGPDVVLNKLFPKKSKVELDFKLGMVLNTSYQSTFLANLGLTYFWSEEWGFNVEGYLAMASDKAERGCIETFYNDPNFAVSAECGGADGLEEDTQKDANWGPAYVPIRKLKYMAIANLHWNPIYGKQIVLMSATNYFDFYIATGGGVAVADFYPLQDTFEDGRSTRGAFCTKKSESEGKCSTATQKNPGTDQEELTGLDGRPLPQSQLNPLVHLAIGQRFHFFKRFLATASLENYTLLGTYSGFDNFFAINVGMGVRF